MRTALIFLLSGILLPLLLCSCSSVPLTGRSQLMLVSEEQENALGLKAWQEIKSKERAARDPRYQQALTRVGKHIAPVVGRPDFKWEFMVFDSKVPNAFCLPGGKVAVYNGLFQYTANDAELATVVGHEVAHAAARHSGERISHQMIQQVGAAALQIGLENGDQLLGLYGLASNVGAILPYSRVHEYEADKLGLFYMAKAGYDPDAAIAFWKKFAELSKINMVEELLTTHPAGDNRIEELRESLAKAREFYNKAPEKLGLGELYCASMRKPEFLPVRDKKFSKASFGYQLTYPGDWQARINQSSLSVSAPAGGSGQVYIQNILDQSRGGSYANAAAVAGAVQDKLRRTTQQCNISAQQTPTVKGYAFIVFNSEFVYKDVSYRQQTHIVRRKDRQLIYIINFTVRREKYESLLPQAQKIINSFSITGDKP